MGLLAAALATTIAPAALHAQVSQTWIDANPNNLWSLSSLNWDTGTEWTNGNQAVFGGTGETVEIQDAITVGDITFNSNGYTIADEDTNGTLTLGLTSTITVTTAGHSATISEGLSGSALTKTGAGILTLSGNNAYSGVTTVSGGRLNVGSDTALGSTAAGTVVSSGTEIALLDGVNISGEEITITGNGASFGGALTTAGSATWGGKIIVNGASRIGAGAGGSMTVTGPIEGGTLEVAGAEGTGTVIISGTNNTYTGETQIVRGFLQLGATNALPTTTVLSVDSSTATEDAYFDLNGFDQTVGGLKRGGNGEGGGSYITNLGENLATLTIATSNAANTDSYNGRIIGAVAISKTGAGTLVLSGDNDFSGDVSVKGASSVLRVLHENALGDTTGVTLAGSAGRVVLGNGVTITGETIRIDGGGDNYGALQAASGGTSTWAGKVVLNDGSGARVGTNTGGTLILSGPIENGMGNSIAISATGANLGTVIISGTENTYTGNTSIIRGILKIGANNALPTGTTLNVDSVASTAVTESAIFDLNGFNQTVSGLASSGADVGTNGVFIRNSGATASTLTLNQATGTTSTFTGVIEDGTNSLALTKAGAGTLVLTKAQTYTGATTLTGGTVELRSAAGALASTSINVGGGGWFVLNNQNPANNNANRLVDTAQVTLNQGNFSLRGSDSAASTETVGTFTLASGLSHIKVTHGTANNATLSTDLVRNDHGGVGFVYGIDLGMDGTSTSGVGRILLDATPELIGSTSALETGRNSDVHDTMIVPYLVGEVDPVTGLGRAGGTPNTFVTYHSTGGLRPLDVATEFKTDTQVDGANTRILTTSNFTSGTVNSILMAAGGEKLNLSGQLVNTSGAILFTESTDIQGGNLHFGSTEAIITVNSGRTGVIGSTTITGSGGMTVNGPGTLGLGGGSDYTGGTFVQGGAVIVPQRNTLGEPDQVTTGPFGTGDIVFKDGGIRSSSGAAYTIGNSIKLRGDLNLAGGGNNLALTGSVGIEGGSRTITNSSASTTTFSGAISDGGNGYGLNLAGSGSGAVVFAGANTYTGPTNLQSGSLIVSGSIAGSTFVGNSAAPSDAATLRGSGTLGSVAALTSGATIDPGAALDTTASLKTGALSLSNGAHLSLQIGGITAGAAIDGHDQIVASGQVSLTGGDLKLTLLGTPTLALGDQLFLITNNSSLSIMGGFATLNGAAFNPASFMLGGQEFSLVYNANFTGAGSDNIANDMALIAVPEPTSAAMLLAGLATLGFSRAGRRLRRTPAGQP